MDRDEVLIILPKNFSFQVRDLDFGIRIIGVEAVREEDGLAMSSRNVRLSFQEREKVLPLIPTSRFYPSKLPMIIIRVYATMKQ